MQLQFNAFDMQFYFLKKCIQPKQIKSEKTK